MYCRHPRRRAGADGADNLIVPACIDGENNVAWFAVPADTFEIEVAPFAMIDGRMAADLVLRDAKVWQGDLLVLKQLPMSLQPCCMTPVRWRWLRMLWARWRRCAT